MIYGRKQLVTDETKEEAAIETMYDFLGVPYIEGYINQEHTYFSIILILSTLFIKDMKMKKR